MDLQKAKGPAAPSADGARGNRPASGLAFDLLSVALRRKELPPALGAARLASAAAQGEGRPTGP